MKRLKVWMRMLRLRLCRLRGHHIVPDTVVFGWSEPDRMVDGVIVPGGSYEVSTVACRECGR